MSAAQPDDKSRPIADLYLTGLHCNGDMSDVSHSPPGSFAFNLVLIFHMCGAVGNTHTHSHKDTLLKTAIHLHVYTANI